MSLGTALVVFCMLWFLVFLVMLAIPFETQDSSGDVVPGTPKSAPARLNLARRIKLTTLIAAGLLAVVAWAVTSGAVTWHDLDMFHRFGPGSARSGGGTGG